MSATTSGLRDRKKELTRSRIEEVALSLFDEKGFDGATIEEIAAGADIAPRTFFHYFPSKEDVVLADYSMRLERIVAALNASPPQKAPWQALRDAFLGVAADYETERDQLLRRFRIISRSPSVSARNLLLQTTWEDAVTGAVAGWLGVDPTRDLRPRLIAGSALAAMRASLDQWLAGGGQARLPDHIEYCFEMIGSGFDDIGGLS